MKGQGVLRYVQGRLERVINFPEDEIICGHCPFCRSKYVHGQRRYICIETYEELQNPMQSLGQDCPLQLTKEDTQWQS